jgi:hypothetical protein
MLVIGKANAELLRSFVFRVVGFGLLKETSLPESPVIGASPMH